MYSHSEGEFPKESSLLLTPKAGLLRQKSRNDRFGFTLAEVLITLGIIGVVAAMTIPALIANQREKETVVRLKKTYSTISNAYTLILEEYGDPTNWGLTKENYSEILTEYFSKYIKGVTVCSKFSSKKCFVSSNRKDLRNKTVDKITSNQGLIMEDGIVIGFGIQDQQQLTSGCVYLDYCFNIIADINGDRLPNRWGVDTFTFHVNKNKIIPRGALDTHSESTLSCAPNADSHSGWYNGSGCTAWVLYKENMDYIKCVNGSQSYCNKIYNFE